MTPRTDCCAGITPRRTSRTEVAGGTRSTRREQPGDVAVIARFTQDTISATDRAAFGIVCAHIARGVVSISSSTAVPTRSAHQRTAVCPISNLDLGCGIHHQRPARMCGGVRRQFVIEDTHTGAVFALWTIFARRAAYLILVCPCTACGWDGGSIRTIVASGTLLLIRNSSPISTWAEVAGWAFHLVAKS